MTLADLIDTLRQDHDARLSVVGIRWQPQALGDGGTTIELAARLYLGSGDSKPTTLRCGFVVDYRIEKGPIDEVEHLTGGDHPLLRRYTDLHASLFFHGEAPRPREVLGALWEEHQLACGHWIAADAHLRADAAALLAGGRGRLATGPRHLLDRYARVLEAHGIEASIVGDAPFQEWRGGQWRDRTHPPQALLLGRSYVIADSFR